MAEDNKILRVGKKTIFTFNELHFNVEIIATRKRRAQEYLIKPISGTGELWVETFIKRNTNYIKKHA